MAASLDDLSGAISEVAASVGPSVVGIGGGGSGVVVGDGLVVTNAHNLRGEEVVVTFPDRTRSTGRIAGADLEGDLAIVSVDTSAAEPIAWAGRLPRLGEVVLGLAHPGGRGLRVGIGVISALDVAFRGPSGRRIAGALEHTAPLARGSSGGPLVDGEGRLLGIDTHREGDGFYLAVPADDELRRRIDALSRGDKPRRARLGVALAPPRVARRLRQAVGLPERDGLLVRGVEEGGPAGRAGIRQGDLIVAAGGSELTSTDELAEILAAHGPDGTIELGVVRGVEELLVAVDLGAGGTGDSDGTGESDAESGEGRTAS